MSALASRRMAAVALVMFAVGLGLLLNGARIGPGHTDTLATMLFNLFGGVAASGLGLLVSLAAVLQRPSRSRLAWCTLALNGLLASLLLWSISGWYSG